MIVLVALAGVILTAISSALAGLAWCLCKLIPWDAEAWIVRTYVQPWAEKTIPVRWEIYDRIMAIPAGRPVLSREIWDPDTKTYLAPDVVVTGLARALTAEREVRGLCRACGDVLTSEVARATLEE